MTDTSSSRSTKETSERSSREFGSNIPADAPEWARTLATHNHQRFDKIEGLLENLHELVGRVMGFTMQTKQTTDGVKELAEVTAVRLQAFTKTVDVKADDIVALRKQVHALRRDGVFQSDVITTDQREIVTREQAEQIALAADEKRDREREIRDLREQNATQAKQIADIAAKQAESSQWWKRNATTIVITGLVGLMTSITSVYVVYRLTKPAVSQTIEYKDQPHAK
jgi:hypothetical protein